MGLGCLKCARLFKMNAHFEGQSLLCLADSICKLPSHPHFRANKDTMQFWNELEGQTIDGRYPLRRLVRSEGRSAWFETETGEPQSAPATISLTEALTDADEVIARLQAAQNLKQSKPGHHHQGRPGQARQHPGRLCGHGAH